MTHEELLAKIATPNEFIGVKYAPDWQSAALRAVVELHKSDEEALCPECSLELNGVMQWAVTWPCLTIQAIEKALS